MIQSLGEFLEYGFLFQALLAIVLISLVTGLISPFIVAKKFSYIGDGISHASLLGVTLGITFFPETSVENLYLIIFVVTGIALFFLARATYRQTIPSDSSIGIFLTATLALSVLVNNLMNQGRGDFLHYLFGNILLIENADLMILTIAFLITLFLITLLWKHWLFVCFDEEGALVNGVKTKVFHYLFFFLIALIVISSLKACGAILVNSFLIIPGVLAYKVGKNMKQVVLISMSFSLLSSLFYLFVSNWLNLPTGATLAFGQFLILVLVTIIQKVMNKESFL